ncbi:Ig-like domain repeat protein [Nocardioides plantarum]|uniref:Ig-like domain repeat protein n=1 Tax=Nocardioides plantarum TaxID=29299 RepID=A0ABV5K4R6_9ACTN|nr:Ig-like domain repeat protein [Nocardioides plantarum]
MSSTLSTRAPRGRRARHLLAAGLALTLGVGAVQTASAASASAADSGAGHERAAVGTVYEAEDQVLTGVTKQTEHAGYSGTGYVGGFGATGNSVLTTVTAAATATYDLDVRYANGGGTKTLTLVVNGTERQLTLPGTGGWANYGTLPTRIDLTDGANVVELRRNAADSGSLNLDRLKVVPQIGTRYQAEDAALTNGAAVSTEHAGFTGTGFVGGYWNEGATTTFAVPADEAGESPAVLRYGAGPNPFNGAKRVTLVVNGASQPIILPGFDTWKDWGEFPLSLPLRAGANEVAIRFAPGDDGNVNIDHLDVGAPVPPTCDETIVADDAFDGDELDRCRWTTILNESADGYRVADGALEIDARDGDLSGGVANARNVVLQPAPTTDAWMTETAVSLDGTDNYLQAGLVLWGNAANFAKIMVMRTPADGWTVELGKVTDGKHQYADSAALPTGAQDDVRLRLWADAGRLRGSYSLDDGATWTVIGAEYGTEGLTSPYVGLGAFNGTGAETARFDEFTVGAPVRVDSTVTVSATPASVAVGEPSAVTVQVAAPGATPTGDVTLYDGPVVVGSGPLTDGSATFQVGPYTAAGDHPLSATYAGDTAVAGSTGTGSLVVVANPDPVESTVTVSAAPSTVPVGSSSILTVRVAAPGITPTGQVSVRAGDEVIGSADLNDGTATFQVGPYASAGVRTYTATYLGNDDVAGSTGTGSLTVTAADPQTIASVVTVTAAPGSVQVGGSATITVAVSAEGATPTGKVTLRESGVFVGSGNLVDGTVSFEDGPFSSPGTRTYTATYDGDDTVAGSTGTGSLSVTAVPDPEPVASTVTVVASPGTVQVGQRAAVTVTVAADGTTPAGAVTLRDNGRVLATGTLRSGKATFTVGPYAGAATHTFMATYAGSASVAAGSGTARLVVKAAPRPAIKVRSKVVDAVADRSTGRIKIECVPAGVRCVGPVELRAGGKLLGLGRIDVAGGRTSNVVIRLSARAKAALAKQPSLRANLTVTLKGGGEKRILATLKR